MLTAYQHLLRLYPKTYRKQFGDEMFAVFEDVRSEINHKGALARIAFPTASSFWYEAAVSSAR